MLPLTSTFSVRPSQGMPKRRFPRTWIFPFVLAALCFVSTDRLPAGQSNGPASSEARGIDLESLDKTCAPCQDFYRFANGEWLKKNPIPAAYPRWGRFDALAEANREHLRQILEKEAANRSAAPGSNEQKIGDFYASCMDEPRINADGAKPIQPELARIDAIQNAAGLRTEVGRLQALGIRAVFRFGSTQDEKNSSQVIGGADQGGLGLPDRDYYSKTDDKSKQIREQYVEHIARMFELLGEDPTKAGADAKTILDLETKLAEASLTRVERRDPEKTYHKMDRGQLRKLTPNFSWESYFREIGYPGIQTVDVSAPKFFETVSQELKAEPLPAWKTYLRWHLVNTAAPWLSQAFVDEDFDFKGRILQGTQELMPRWRRCVAAADRELGEALGQFYVQQYFPAEAKARAQEMVSRLVVALRNDLQNLPWMGPATRQQALAKLAAFNTKIGYPDKWRDYSAYQVDRGSYAENLIRGGQFEFKRDLNKIGKPVDRTEWDMTPPTVNAYYDAEKNEIVFPAGILQPPFYDPNADDASNYGGIGAVIGHEMTHGFDDQGRKFDAQGNLRDWWTPEDAKNFDARAECVSKQFDSYVVEGDLHENGKLELGESIADLGGLVLAYRALEQDIEGKPHTPIGGFTQEQRFFISFSQIWSTNTRPEYERLLVNTDPHPLARFRGFASPSNMSNFAQAFGCKSGDPMVRSTPCQIW
jgi:putative endopeptidase